MSTVKRTYGSKPPRLPPDASSSSSPAPSPPRDHHQSRPDNRKRPLLDYLSAQNLPPSKKRSICGSSSHKLPATSSTKPTTKLQRKAKPVSSKEKAQKQLTQLHFSLDTTVLRTCAICSLTYTRGAPDDESLHRAHCGRVQRGMEWGKEEEREANNGKVKVEEIQRDVRLKNGTKGRIICFRADVGGKIGAKLKTLLDSVNITLSAPSMTEQSLRASKAYLFLLPTGFATIHREKIVGCVIAQRISTAMAIAPRSQRSVTESPLSPSSLSTDPASQPTPSQSFDSSTSLSLLPTPLPTPLGIPRLFVSSAHRRLGIALRLLDAAASHFILGCPLDPKKGEVAFSQPTGLGSMVLEKWAGGNGRVFEE